ncbi:DUF1320 domain-containing protein [bacterium]|nr:DUF1320 domain-containing protein [bacterium]
MFCTCQDLIDQLGERTLIQLTDDSPQPKTVNAAICNDTIAAAEELMLSKLAGRYRDVSELQSTPLLRRLAIDICAYYLYSRRNKGDIENVKRRYDDAIKELSCIRLGQSTPPQEAGQFYAYRTSKRSSDRWFTDQVWERF